MVLAQEHGADRIELCQNLEQGGVTPSFGFIKEALNKAKVPVHVLIRPRPGDFNYNSHEIQTQCYDTEMCRDLGCAGVVVGTESHLDLLMKHAGSLEVTYNRHFDDGLDLEQHLEQIIAAGCHRILTSGGSSTAENGIEKLKSLVRRANGRIQIMAGAGINPSNVQSIIRETGVSQIHASCKRVVEKSSRSQSKGLFDADEIEVDADILDELVARLGELTE